MGSTQPVFEHEYSVFYRPSKSGRAGPLRRRFSPTAREAIAIITELGEAGVLVSLARREVGSWERIDRNALESAAAEEGAHP